MLQTTEKPEDKREKLKKLREFHQPVLDEYNVPDAVFLPKMAYKPYGKSEIHIAFFASEISKGEDVYVEFTNKENVPEDPERKLYKWKFNPHFEAEYEKTEPNAVTGHCRYLVPVMELINIVSKKAPMVATKKAPPLEMPIQDPNEDAPFNQLTIRDLAALLLRKPVSHKDWLNEVITKSI